MTENQYQRANRMVLITILIVFGFIAVTVLAALGVSKGEQPGRIIIQFITALIVYDCINRSIHNEKENTYM